MNFQKIQEHLQAAQEHMKAASLLMGQEEVESIDGVSLPVAAAVISRGMPKDMDDIASRDRDYETIKCRVALVYQLHTIGFGVTAIARLLNRNHATIIHSLKCYPNMYDTDENFREQAQKAASAAYDIMMSVNQPKPQEL